MHNFKAFPLCFPSPVLSISYALSAYNQGAVVTPEYSADARVKAPAPGNNAALPFAVDFLQKTVRYTAGSHIAHQHLAFKDSLMHHQRMGRTVPDTVRHPDSGRTFLH